MEDSTVPSSLFSFPLKLVQASISWPELEAMAEAWLSEHPQYHLYFSTLP